MEAKDLSELAKQLEKNHKLLQENNFLLHKIMKQNQLVFEATQKNIRHFSGYWIWYESGEVKNLREELSNLYEEVMK